MEYADSLAGEMRERVVYVSEYLGGETGGEHCAVGRGMSDVADDDAGADPPEEAICRVRPDRFEDPGAVTEGG